LVFIVIGQDDNEMKREFGVNPILYPQL